MVLKNPFQTGDVKTSIPKMLVGQTPRFSNYEYDHCDDDQCNDDDGHNDNKQ